MKTPRRKSLTVLLCFLLSVGAFCQSEDTEDEEYSRYRNIIDVFEEELEAPEQISENDIESFAAYITALGETSYVDLLSRGRTILFQMKEYAAVYRPDYDPFPGIDYQSGLLPVEGEESRYGSRGFTALLVNGLASIGLFNLFTVLSSEEYRLSAAAVSSAEARFHGDRQTLFNALAYMSLGMGVLSLGGSIPLLADYPFEEPLNFSAQTPPTLFPSGETPSMRLNRLTRERERLRRNVDQIKEENTDTLEASRTFLGIGISTSVITAISLIMGDLTYRQYNMTTYSTDAEILRSQIEVYRWFSIISAGVAGVSFGLSSVLYTSMPDTSLIEQEIKYLDEQIADLISQF
jgi:hypothetical protein